MSKQGDIFSDLSKLVMGAAGAARSAQKEIETLIQEQIRKYVSSADWVSREEFDMVREAALSAHAQVKTLTEKVAQLETGGADKSAPKSAEKKAAKPAKKPVKKPVKKTTRKTALNKTKTAGQTSSTGKSSKK